MEEERRIWRALREPTVDGFSKWVTARSEVGARLELSSVRIHIGVDRELSGRRARDLPKMAGESQFSAERCSAFLIDWTFTRSQRLDPIQLEENSQRVLLL